ncbi:MAG: DNA polymerase III subunit alpha, partial [Proteobacteria bacterium]|nr:DNA polymerase III subunit alpha [Pseudomonadota bacterium]
KGPDGTLITQYEMKNAEKVGLVKFDFLGLKTLTVIARAVKLIRATKDPKFNIDTIDLERKEVYELVSSAHSVGIFQLESSGMQSLLKKLKPSRFEDIIAVVALFRPGPLGSGMVDDFIERKHGRQEIEYLHPLLESVLADTYGIILYQEQVQKIAAILANYTLGEADLLRRAMGKKKPEEMAKQKARFVSGCHDNKVNEKLADEIFELMAKFAAYGFNKSHSAAYGLVSYQTAYLKTFYPEQFMAAIMTCDLDNADKIVRYIEECRRLKFTIYPPDINRSYLEFDVPRDKAIGFGLAAIKGIGGTSIEAMIEERKKSGKFGSLTDFAKRVDLHKLGKKTLELLIQGGGLDGFGKQRPTLMSLLSEMVKYSEAHHSAKSHGQRLLFDEFDDDPKLATRADWEEQAADAEASSSPIEWLHKEKKLLSVYLSSHPTECYGLDVKRFGQIKLSDIAKHIGKKGLHCVALLGTVTERLTKKGKRMSYFPLEDETGSWEAVAFEGDLGADVKFEAGTMVLAQLNIQQGFDGNSINVRIAGLQTLEQVRRKTIKHATIQVTSQLELDAAALFRQQRLIQRLNSMLIEHPGPTPLGLELSFEKAQVKIKPGRGGIDLSDRICQSIFSLKREGISLLYN